MGTDSEDIYGELSVLLPQKALNMHLWFDKEKHNISGPQSFESKEYGLRIENTLTSTIRLDVSFKYIDLDKNLGQDTYAISTKLTFLF